MSCWQGVLIPLGVVLISGIAGNAIARDCVISIYALRGTTPVYVDVAPFPSRDSHLSAAVLQIPVPRLLAGNALKSRQLVLLDDFRSDKERQEVCDKLAAAGYADVSFLRENTRDLKWKKNRVVPGALPAHGWKTIEASDVHQLLGRPEYFPVYLAPETDAIPPQGFSHIQTLEELSGLLVEYPKRQIVVFAHSNVEQPPLLPDELRSGALWWVSGGVTAYLEYQQALTLSLLDRRSTLKACGRL